MLNEIEIKIIFLIVKLYSYYLRFYVAALQLWNNYALLLARRSGRIWERKRSTDRSHDTDNLVGKRNPRASPPEV